MAMQKGRKHLPGFHVKHMRTDLQTSSIVEFTKRIKQYDDTLEFRRFQSSDHDRSNNPKVLIELFNFTLSVHTEMRSIGTWRDAMLSKLQSSFTTTY